MNAGASPGATGSRWKTWQWLVPLNLVVLALVFEAGKRYPFALFERPAARPILGWQAVTPAPIPIYESASAVIGGRLYVFGGFLNWPQGDVTPRIDVYDPATNSWSRRKDMPRGVTHRHAAVNGDTAWFAGGFVGSNPGTATDEVMGYDAVGDTWFEAPKLPSSRASGALVWHRGRLHYYGGFGPDRGRGLEDHLVLDLSLVAKGRGQWRQAAPLPEPRGQLAGAVVGGFLYAIGGTTRHDPIQATIDAVHRYDPVTDSWSEVASLPTPRSHFEAATFVYNGRIGIAGGWNLTAHPRDVADVSMYDPEADQWTTVLRLPKRALAGVAGVIGDTLIAGLGSTDLVGPEDPSLWMHRLSPAWLTGDPLPVVLGEVAGGVIQEQLFLLGFGNRHTLALDLRSGRWRPPDRYGRRPARNHGQVAEVVDGKLYLLGGLGGIANLVQIFDPVQERWSFGPDMPFRAAYSASAVIGGEIYVAGGIAGDTTIGSAARLDRRTGVWRLVPPMPLPRSHSASATDGVKLYVFGGRRPSHGTIATGSDEVQIFDPITHTWSVSRTGPGAPAPLPVSRQNTGKAVYTEGKFWVVGGTTDTSASGTEPLVANRVDIYDPVRDTWTSGPPLPTARHGALAVLHDGQLYVAGGGTGPNTRTSSVLEILRLSLRSGTSGLAVDTRAK